MVHREVRALAIARAQGSYAQHIGNELHCAAIPGPDHGTRAREPLRLPIGIAAPRRLPGFVLDQPVGPGDAHHVHRSRRARVEQQRHTGINGLAVQRPGLDFHLRVLRQLEILDAFEPHADPVRRSAAAVERQVNLAVGRNAGAIHRGRRYRNRLPPATRRAACPGTAPPRNGRPGDRDTAPARGRDRTRPDRTPCCRAPRAASPPRSGSPRRTGNPRSGPQTPPRLHCASAPATLPAESGRDRNRDRSRSIRRARIAAAANWLRCG